MATGAAVVGGDGCSRGSGRGIGSFGFVQGLWTILRGAREGVRIASCPEMCAVLCGVLF